MEDARTRAALLLRRQGLVQQTLSKIDAQVEEELHRLTAGTPSKASGKLSQK